MTSRKIRLQPLFTPMENVRVDRAAQRINGVVTMLENVEAIGHGFMSDRKTLEMTRDLGNAAKFGIMTRFGHPGISENSAGLQLGRSNNFRIVEGQPYGKLVNDIQFMDAARLSPRLGENVLDYLYDIAENYSTEMGMSVVVRANTVWVTASGYEYDSEEFERPPDATTELPLLRPEFFYNNDMVSEGALTHEGMFAVLSANSSIPYAAEAFELVDEWIARYNIPLSAVPEKVNTLVASYMESRKMAAKTKVPTRRLETAVEDPELLLDNDAPEEETMPPVDAPPDEEGEEDGSEDNLDETLSIAESMSFEIVSVDDQRLENRLTALEADNAKLKRALRVTVDNLAALQQQVAGLSQEPFVTTRVSRTNPAARQRTPGTIPAQLAAQPLRHVSQKRGAVQLDAPVVDDPVRSSYVRNQALKRQHGTGAG